MHPFAHGEALDLPVGDVQKIRRDHEIKSFAHTGSYQGHERVPHDQPTQEPDVKCVNEHEKFLSSQEIRIIDLWRL